LVKTQDDTVDGLHHWMHESVKRDTKESVTEAIEALKESTSHLLDMGVHRIEVVAQGRSLANEERLTEELLAEATRAAGQEETPAPADPESKRRKASRLEIVEMLQKWKSLQVTARDLGEQAPDHAVVQCTYCDARILKDLVRCDECGTRNTQCSEPFVTDEGIKWALEQECKQLIKTRLVQTGARGNMPPGTESRLRHDAIKRKKRAIAAGYADFFERWQANDWIEQHQVHFTDNEKLTLQGKGEREGEERDDEWAMLQVHLAADHHQKEVLRMPKRDRVEKYVGRSRLITGQYGGNATIQMNKTMKDFVPMRTAAQTINRQHDQGKKMQEKDIRCEKDHPMVFQTKALSTWRMLCNKCDGPITTAFAQCSVGCPTSTICEYCYFKAGGDTSRSWGDYGHGSTDHSQGGASSSGYDRSGWSNRS